MRAFGFGLWAALVVFCAALPSCAPLREAGVLDRLGDLAGRVCVEGDTLSVCVAKCQAELEEGDAP